MDSTLKKLTDFTLGLRYEDLPPEAIQAAKRRVLDTLACALGAYTAEPSKIARTLAHDVTGRTPARVFGSLEETSPELAAFANGVMIRYLDLNDATGSGGGHPSDALAALLSAAETHKTDGKTLILAFAIVYELYLGFFAANRIRNRGWDHLVYTILGATAAISKMRGFDHATTANAISLALVPNMTLEVVRRGQLTMWKGCAGGNAARNAVFATQLAAQGMTCSQEVFEGEHGVWTVVGETEWPKLPGAGEHFRIADSQIKIYPCEYHGQAPIQAALAIRPEIDPREIEKIVVRTYWFAWSEIGSEPEKWEPNTRETADHSIPFLVAAALLDGKVNPSSFTPARIFDPELRALIRKVEVIYDKELDKFQPGNNPCYLEITLKNGEKKLSHVENPKGHVKNPASDKDIEGKLAGLAEGLLSPKQIATLTDLCWRLDDLEDVRELTSAMRI